MNSVRPNLSIIVPFHKGLDYLERALRALVPLNPADELIVVADGAVDDCRPLAATYGARVLEIEGPKGPAAARNAAVATARGDVVLFVDADVVASVQAVERVAQIMGADPTLSALFGAYDEAPGAPGFVSQYKNLAHRFIHKESSGPAKTFWAGFGAVRRDAYESVGGFDERFERPSIEDIDLGYRMTAAGHRMLIDPSLAVCHLKHWTLKSMIKSDVFDRGIPWTQLMLRYGQFGDDLNVKASYKACVVVAYLAVVCLALTMLDLRFLLGVPIALAVLAYLSRAYYLFFLEQRGLAFALVVFPLHVLHHLYNGFSFVAGTVLFFVARRFGVRLPCALPPFAQSSSSCYSRSGTPGAVPGSPGVTATPDA